MDRRLLFALLALGLFVFAAPARAQDDDQSVDVSTPADTAPPPDEQSRESSVGQNEISAGAPSTGGAPLITPAGTAKGRASKLDRSPLANLQRSPSSGGGGGAASGPLVIDPPEQVQCPPGGQPQTYTRSGGGDEIDLSKVQVVGGGAPGDVTVPGAWRRTAMLTSLDLQPNGATLDFTKKNGAGRWPDVLIPGWDGGNLQYTLWIVVAVDGQWYTTGVFEFWSGDVTNGGAPSGFRKNGYYFADPMSGHQPKPGEPVGFFLTSGDQRRKDVHTIKERTNVVLVPFPNDCGATFQFTP